MDNQDLLAVPDEISPDERDAERKTDEEQKNTESINENIDTEDQNSAAPVSDAEKTEDG